MLVFRPVQKACTTVWNYMKEIAVICFKMTRQKVESADVPASIGSKEPRLSVLTRVSYAIQ